jgi:hypothetical protein
MRRRQVSEASGNALRRGLCYKCMLRGSEEHWALAQYGLAQTRAEHSPLISQMEMRSECSSVRPWIFSQTFHEVQELLQYFAISALAERRCLRFRSPPRDP